MCIHTCIHGPVAVHLQKNELLLKKIISLTSQYMMPLFLDITRESSYLYGQVRGVALLF